LAAPGTGAADALYANGGYGPASQLNNAGAAFTTAAQGLSTQALGLGAQGAQSALYKGAETQKELSQQLMDLLAKKPQLLDDALRSLRGEQQQNYANAIQANYLAQREPHAGIDATGFDPVTGQPAPGYIVDPKTGRAATFPRRQLRRKAAATAKAVGKRNDATVSSLVNGRDWVEKQLKPGSTPQHVADVPIKVGMTSPIKDSKGHIIVAARPMYAKKGGGTTHNINEAATKAVYSQQPIPRPQYQKLLRQLTGRLTTELRRYGYKPAQIRKASRTAASMQLIRPARSLGSRDKDVVSGPESWARAC
jgi:hypothetical protein